jgi:hypothetical protein
MLKIQISGIQQAMAGLERELDQFVARVANETKSVAVSLTPIDKGRARRGWRTEKRSHGYSVVNRVPYIDELEKGHSKQAPNGIIGPTIREINRRNIQ